jgi:hypothetical protein
MFSARIGLVHAVRLLVQAPHDFMILVVFVWLAGLAERTMSRRKS